MPQALYRKWRPIHWDQVIGQPHVVQTLRNAIAANRIAHAYLFAGPRGTGKTTAARLLAKAVNCLDENLAERPCNRCEHCLAVNQGRFLDLIEIDAASNTSVDDVRDLREKINFTPNLGRFKVYIVDEVHMLSTAAFNALLKTLEEPPAHAIFVLATTEVHKIPPTVLSRCQRHEFRRIPVAEIVAYLQVLAKGENIQVEPEALTLIARQATGAMRDAISLLDQLASCGLPVTLEMAQSVLGTATSQAVLGVLEALLAGDSAAGLDVIHRALDAGSDPRQFARQVVEYLRNLLLISMGNAAQVDTATETRVQMARHAQALGVPGILRLIQLFNQAAVDSRPGWQPALPLEMAYIEAVLPTAAPLAVDAAPVAAQRKRVAVEKSTPAEEKPAAQPLVPEVESELPAEEIAPVDASANQLINDQWRKILAAVRQQDPQLYGLINSCRAKLLRDNVLFLTFASDVLQAKMEKAENVRILQDVLRQLLEMEIIIRCQVVTGKRSSPPPDVDSDGMVAAAVRDLGGEIVDVQ
ncbi:MAG: DNA polymerase III subunit gamma/tau [Anaerolineales bacterium]|nr:DNA polymerase III subunit gamma/tau [Anaerolineales bacterium]